MKLYTTLRAPNPRRVHVFLAEKGVEIPSVIVNLGDKQQFTEEFTRLNPDNVVPVLIMDDDTVISESVAICRVLEEVFPAPALFGRDARERGLVEMWSRRLELQAYIPTQDAYRNSRKGFAGRALPGVQEGVPQIPQLVPRANATIRRMLAKLDAQLRDNRFVVGAEYTMADIIGMVTLDFGQRTGMDAVETLDAWPNVERWYAEVSARPSASAGPPGA